MLKYIVGYFTGAVATNIGLDTMRKDPVNLALALYWPAVIPIGTLCGSVYYTSKYIRENVIEKIDKKNI